MSRCRSIRSLILSKPLADLTAAERATVQIHLAECPRCKRLSERLIEIDLQLTLLCQAPPAMRSAARHGFAASRVRFVVYAAAFALAAILGTGFGIRYGAGSLFGPAYAADLDGRASGLPNLGFDDARVPPQEDWSAADGSGKEMPLESFARPSAPSPNFCVLDSRETRLGSGRSLKLYLRSFGGSVLRTIPGPFPAGTVVYLRSWVLMPKPGSTDNKWLSIGIGSKPTDPSHKEAVALVDVFDASPYWRPYTISTGLTSAAQALTIRFSSGAGDGAYQGWDRAAWIDDVQLEISVPLAGTAQSSGDRIQVRIEQPAGFQVSPRPQDLGLRLYGEQTPRFAPASVETDGKSVTCTYEAPGLAGLIARGNPDTGDRRLPIEIKARLRRGGLTVEGSFGASVLPNPPKNP